MDLQVPLDKLSGEKVVQIFFPSEMDVFKYFCHNNDVNKSPQLVYQFA